MRPSSTLAKELAEREGFELGEAVNGISKLLMRKGVHVPSNPLNSPFLPPDLRSEFEMPSVDEDSHISLLRFKPVLAFQLPGTLQPDMRSVLPIYRNRGAGTLNLAPPYRPRYASRSEASLCILALIPSRATAARQSRWDRRSS